MKGIFRKNGYTAEIIETDDYTFVFVTDVLGSTVYFGNEDKETVLKEVDEYIG